MRRAPARRCRSRSATPRATGSRARRGSRAAPRVDLRPEIGISTSIPPEEVPLEKRRAPTRRTGASGATGGRRKTPKKGSDAPRTEVDAEDGAEDEADPEASVAGEAVAALARAADLPPAPESAPA